LIDKTFHKIDGTKYSFTVGESDIMITFNHGMTTELKNKNHMKNVKVASWINLVTQAGQDSVPAWPSWCSVSQPAAKTNLL